MLSSKTYTFRLKKCYVAWRPIDDAWRPQCMEVMMHGGQHMMHEGPKMMHEDQNAWVP